MMQQIHSDFDPFELDKKFPVSFSLESIATLIVPMKDPLSDCRREYDSMSTEKCDDSCCYDSVDINVDKLSSAGSYLIICEDCECNSKSQGSDVQGFLTSRAGKSITTHSDQISGKGESRARGSEDENKTEADNSSKCRFTVTEEADIAHHERDSVGVSVDQRELAGSRTDFDTLYSNDSGIECGSTN